MNMPTGRTGPTLRRLLLLSLVVLTTLMALALLFSVYQSDGLSPLEILLLVLYTVLFAWICSSFWTAAIGFVLCWFQRDRYAITASDSGEDIVLPKTALVMPIYNEDPERVFAGLRAIWQSLQETGQGQAFDLFVLSDTRDPDTWVEEELRWQRLCRDVGGEGRVFYRNRPQNTGRKCGNLTDFCTRWGGHYRYMIVLDADSLMSGSTLVTMTRLMERNPRVALLQVPPLPVNRESLFARILQFASSIYGRMYTAGLNFWQLGDGNYWGHNAIIRIEPFVAYCGLPKLPGAEPFGGEILSHDFIEAALLRRAGWEIWLAYDLGGSFEEIPATLIDYAKRDRRWCQGNLQHTRLLTARGLRPAHRLHMVMGVMSYLASPLWLLFLVVTGVQAFIQASQETVYFFGENFAPVWPVSYAVEMTTVLTVTLTILFLPKVLALLLLTRDVERRQAYGGMIKASISVFLETLFSALLAPVLMLFQSKFVMAILLRRSIGWPPQRRGDHSTTLSEAIFAHGGHTLLGIVSGAAAYVYVPEFFWWFVPVLLGLVLSIPLSMFSSSLAVGRKAKQLGLFLAPAETFRPSVLRYLDEHLRHPGIIPPATVERFAQALAEPFVEALHTALLPPAAGGRRRRLYVQGLIYKLLEEGPKSLTMAERRDLLTDPVTVQQIHALLWADVPELTAPGANTA